MRESVKSIKAWQHGHRLVMGVYRAAREFPKSELYGLTSQIRRAAVSVPANIAEGSNATRSKIIVNFCIRLCPLWPKSNTMSIWLRICVI